MPPGVSAKGLTGQAAVEYPVLDAPSAVTPLFDEATSAIPLKEMTDPKLRAKHFSLKYYGVPTPVVTIDYIFVGKGRGAWKVKEAKVAVEPGWPSDHAPLVATLALA